MLHVQTYLQNHSLDDLREEYNIITHFHKTLPFVILNYSDHRCETLEMYNKVRTSMIGRECRNLILNSNDYSLVSKSFTRFFNYNEFPEETNQFQWKNSTALTKEDGSLCAIFNYDNEWHIATRGTFGDLNIEQSGMSWLTAMKRSLGILSLKELDQYLDPSLSYIGEFVSPWNKVVRDYKFPQIYFLTAFQGERELNLDEAAALNTDLFALPEKLQFTSYEEAAAYIRHIADQDETFEGVIVRDANNLRLKIKSEAYIKLHRLMSNKTFDVEDALKMFLEGDQEEFLLYFPECKGQYYQVESEIRKLYSESLEDWLKYNHIPEKRQFYETVKNLKTRPLLASYYDSRTMNQEVDFQNVFRRHERFLKKYLNEVI